MSETQTPYQELLDRCRRQPPRLALVLGSGLGELADLLDRELTVPFGAVPDMAAPSVIGHKGELHLATWAGRRLLLFVGRLHYYEGHPWRRVEQQVPMARELGAQLLLLTNAAGGIRDDLVRGSVMPIADHLEWTGALSCAMAAPWPSPYSLRLLDLVCRSASTVGMTVKPGVYAQVTGPCYETPAEIRALRACGADAVGMSTCREINRAQRWAWNAQPCPLSPTAPPGSPMVRFIMMMSWRRAAPDATASVSFSKLF